jgi:hypothetical protein
MEWTEKKCCSLSLCAAAGPDVIVADQLVLVAGNLFVEAGDDGPDPQAMPPERWELSGNKEFKKL